MSDLRLFEEESGLIIRLGMEGKNVTTYSVGGGLPRFVDLHSADEVQTALTILGQLKAPWRILGNGSNVLIEDEGMEEWVLRLGSGMKFLTGGEGARFYVGGSYSLMTLSRELSEAGWSGLEFAGGIPASFGGAVRMNAGAHGGELCDIIRSVTIVTGSGKREELNRKDLDFTYRRSTLPPDSIVVGASIQLVESSRENAAKRRQECLEERKRRQPLSSASAGSVFKNPSSDKPAGRLIEECGLKGRREGGAMISPLHGNWIINPQRQARSREIVFLMTLCEAEVESRFHIRLEREVRVWGGGAFSQTPA
jgi:UDP-N-acetylmuramate dehydrogenase